MKIIPFQLALITEYSEAEKNIYRDATLLSIQSAYSVISSKSIDWKSKNTINLVLKNLESKGVQVEFVPFIEALLRQIAPDFVEVLDRYIDYQNINSENAIEVFLQYLSLSSSES